MRRWLAILIVLFLVVVVVSPFVDLPLTTLRSVDALYLALVAMLLSLFESVAIGSQFAIARTDRAIAADRDVLDATLAYRC